MISENASKRAVVAALAPDLARDGLLATNGAITMHNVYGRRAAFQRDIAAVSPEARKLIPTEGLALDLIAASPQIDRTVVFNAALDLARSGRRDTNYSNTDGAWLVAAQS